MREAQKVERFRLTFPSSFPVQLGVPPELKPARFVRMQFQPKLPQPFPEVLQKAVGLRLRLETQDRTLIKCRRVKIRTLRKPRAQASGGVSATIGESCQ